MRTSLTVVFELNWKGRNTEKDAHAQAALDGIAGAIADHQAFTFSENHQPKHIAVMEIPAQQAFLGKLLYWCETGGVPYKTRWFTNELD